jgi:hypothetical protein
VILIEVNSLRSNINSMAGDISSLQSDVNSIQSDVSSIQSDVGAIADDLDDLSNDNGSDTGKSVSNRRGNQPYFPRLANWRRDRHAKSKASSLLSRRRENARKR